MLTTETSWSGSSIRGCFGGGGRESEEQSESLGSSSRGSCLPVVVVGTSSEDKVGLPEVLLVENKYFTLYYLILLLLFPCSYLGSEVFSIGLVTLLKNLSRVWDIELAKLQLAVVHVGACLWSNLSSPAHNLLIAHAHVLSGGHGNQHSG